MFIRSFEFEDLRTGWKLERTDLDRLNLLVGNSGVNCMPDVVRFLNTRPDLQFILTSHHPYVINNLPIATWKLVRRRGSIVSVTPAHDIPALQGAS